MPQKPTDKRLTLDGDEPSLLFAINDLLSTGGIDFDDWWKEFSKPPTSKAGKEIEIWTKPKFIDVTPVGKSNIGRWIKYFPDKEDESTFYKLSGSDRDLVYHITAIGYQQGGSAENVSGKNSKPQLKGFPLLELHFISPEKKAGVKWIRCAGYTDDEKIAALKLAKLVTPADIRGWATKIKTIFGDAKYIWRKGDECLSYTGQIARLQGLEGYAYVRNKQDGIDLFAALLKIFDAVPDKDGFNRSESTSTTKYKKQTKEITVAGQKVIPDERRPLVDCEFDHAVLKLPLLNKPIPLVKRNVILYK
ncbi:hypothetical protein [Microcoleus asticus]|uniref:Uncharacterized protein n=1 Tax=Microcoleus asticus IPMA8 TaxID=2563858 RepID=A0ABX2CZ84_9CYAN|nr:hypothetical protein [Microcoleus asticus]NQE35208.1 hypothetical protein [Microcoleus asticus IPMA8]